MGEVAKGEGIKIFPSIRLDHTKLLILITFLSLQKRKQFHEAQSNIEALMVLSRHNKFYSTPTNSKVVGDQLSALNNRPFYSCSFMSLSKRLFDSLKCPSPSMEVGALNSGNVSQVKLNKMPIGESSCL